MSLLASPDAKARYKRALAAESGEVAVTMLGAR
jgi:hypothetical protein